MVKSLYQIFLHKYFTKGGRGIWLEQNMHIYCIYLTRAIYAHVLHIYANTMQVSWSTSTFKLNLNSKLVSFFDHSNQPLDFTFSYCHCLSCEEDEKYACKHSDDVHCRTYSYLFLYKAGSGNYNWQASETWLGALIFTVIISQYTLLDLQSSPLK